MNTPSENPLLQFILRRQLLPPEDAQAIVERIPIAIYPKGETLLREGEIACYCYFILRGLVRQYSLHDGKEKTTAIYTEEQAVVSIASYNQGIPAGHFWVCEEETIAVVGHLGVEQSMYQDFPQLQQLTHVMMTQDFARAQAALETFITSSPEERYLLLMQDRPELMNRLPQHMIASYLGLTPESLSRIRRRIMQRKGPRS